MLAHARQFRARTGKPYLIQAQVNDPASHVRRARGDDPDERILRRAYNYDVIEDGRREAGLLFCSYQADIARQFVPMQQRLAESDRLNRWITHVGSAAFTVLPGCRPGGVLGDRLLAAAGER